MNASIPHLNARRALPPLLAAAVLAAGACVAVELSTVVRDASPGDPAAAHAERTGIRLGDNGLSGRVDLVASAPGLAWRIRGVTPWHTASGRVLVRGWDTTRTYDGPHTLELRDGGRLVTHTLVVRNSTPIASDGATANDSDEFSLTAADGRAVVAAFGRRSYRPGDLATITLARCYPALRVEIVRCGPEQELTVGNETMRGVPVPAVVRVGARSVRVRVGAWPSGLYTAVLRSRGGRVGFAPFVVRPSRLGEHRVAVVLPTNTWQAYNYRDGNGDGLPDSWYGNSRSRVVSLARPFLARGTPPHFRRNDVTFLRWLTHTGKSADVLSQEDLERVSGDRLARLYDLIVFPGHHEYVTESEYDAVQRYRDLGGNLAFLSANNFFWRVDRHGDLLYRIAMWRDLGRPEAALVGVQYFDWNHGASNHEPYVVRGAHHARWLFAETPFRNGSRVGMFGVEADGRTSASPRSIRVIATIENVFGSGRAAEMTYYETPRGARVFAAGAFTFSSTQARRPQIAQLLENLWDRLAGAGPARMPAR